MSVFDPKDGWERQALRILLPIFTAYSFFVTIRGWEENWSIPLILLALTLLVHQVKPVGEIHHDVKYLRTVTEKVPVMSFATPKEFFDAMSNAIGEASNTADLTHIRDTPPDEFGETGADYYDDVFDWAKKSDEHSVRRVVSIRNKRMLEWAKELEKRQEQCDGFDIRVVKWSTEAPAINMGIADGNAVFLSVTGFDVKRTGGIAVEDSDVASYFTLYYEKLWDESTPLSDFLRGKKAEAIAKGR